MTTEQIDNVQSQIPGVSVQGTTSTDTDRGEEAAPAAATLVSRPITEGISPSCGGGKCSCGEKCGGLSVTKPPLVYALGTLSYDFGTEARRDSLLQDGLTSSNDFAALV